MKKLNTKKANKIILIIIAIIVAIIIIFKLNDFIIVGKNKTTNLVINNKNVTLNLKNDILIDNNEVYLSKKDLGNFFDKYIYEDKDNNQIITTYDTKVAVISLDDNKININGSNKKTYLKPITKDETTYIPISELKDVYGIEINYIEKSKVVTIDSTSKEQVKAIATKNLPVKSSTKFIAKTIDRIKKGSYVIVISEENGYTKVRTENGKIGYVKTKKIANKVTVRENIEKSKQISGKVNLVWDYYSEYVTAPNRSGEKMEGVNVVSPAFLYLNSNGELETNIGTSGQAYIEWAHNNGYKVWPMVQNAGTGMTEVTSKLVNSYKNRQTFIDELVTTCVKYKLDGLNIDFENMKEEDKDMFSRLIIELTPRLNDMGLEVSVDVTAPDGDPNWSLCFDRNVIGDVANYIVFMAYDQYGSSSNKAGTTAGYDWVKVSLNKFLTTEDIESDKIILAIPLYTKLWTEDSNGNVVKQIPVSIKNVDNILPDNVSKKWDDDLKQYYVEYTENGYTKKMWVEDKESLSAKITLITDNKLAGVASWKKDFETEDFWSFLDEKINK